MDTKKASEVIRRSEYYLKRRLAILKVMSEPPEKSLERAYDEGYKQAYNDARETLLAQLVESKGVEING